MLVLTTKIGESVHLNGPGSIRLMSIKGSRVQWGITAPSTTKILRSKHVRRAAAKKAA